MENEREITYAERALNAAQLQVNGGVDPELAAEAVNMATKALLKQAKVLEAIPYEKKRRRAVECPSCQAKFGIEVTNEANLSKALSSTAKMIDETARLIHFTSGKPDSHMQVSGLGVSQDILKSLTEPQITQLWQWVEENERASAQ